MKKEKKNIAIISPFFFPEPISTGKFNTDMALALRDKGHTVSVFCLHPFYPKWKAEESNNKIDGIKIIRGGKNLIYSKNTIIRRFVLEIGFSFFLLRSIFKIKKEVDLIITIFPPSLGFYGIIPFLNKKIIKIGMVHDLQNIYSSKKKGILYKVISALINKVENRVYHSCDKLIFLSNEMKETARNHYKLVDHKLKTQYPFVTINTDKITNDLEIILPDNQQHIVYSGALGEKQNPKGLYEIFDFSSKKLTDVMFHFFSQGVAFDELKNKNTNPKIQFHNLVPAENIVELYKRSSIQIIPQLLDTSKGSLPSKLPNLLASGCNILCITDKGSEIEKLFEKFNLKTVVTSWRKTEIYDKILEIIKSPVSNTENQIEVSKKLFNINSIIKAILYE